MDNYTVSPMTLPNWLLVVTVMLAGVGAIHLLTRIWYTLSDLIGARRRSERDAAITDAAKAMSGLAGEMRAARHGADKPRTDNRATPTNGQPTGHK